MLIKIYTFITGISANNVTACSEYYYLTYVLAFIVPHIATFYISFIHLGIALYEAEMDVRYWCELVDTLDEDLTLIKPLSIGRVATCNIIATVGGVLLFWFCLEVFWLHYYIYKLGYKLNTFDDITWIAYLLCLVLPVFLYAIGFYALFRKNLAFANTSLKYKKTVGKMVALCFVSRFIFLSYLSQCGELSLVLEIGGDELGRAWGLTSWLCFEGWFLWIHILVPGLFFSLLVESYLIQMTTNILHSACPSSSDTLSWHQLVAIQLLQGFYTAYISFVIVIIFDCQINQMSQSFIDGWFLFKYFSCVLTILACGGFINSTFTLLEQIVVISCFTLLLLPTIGAVSIFVPIFEHTVQHGESSEILIKILNITDIGPPFRK